MDNGEKRKSENQKSVTFDKYDQDGNGFLERDEIRSFLDPSRNVA